MSFIEHLEELRWNIIRSVGVVLVAMIAVFIAKDWMEDYVIFAPIYADFITYQLLCDLGHAFNLGDNFCFTPIPIEVEAIGVMEAFVAHIRVSIVLGLVIAFPYVLWEIWKFIKPALHVKERKTTTGFVFYCSVLFALGASFAYFVIVPFSFNFLIGYDFGPTQNEINLVRLSDYISYLTMLVLAAGILFELPIFIFFLARLGIIGPEFMKKYRKHALVIIIIFSAMITPPDVASQLLIAIPVMLLYEVGIQIAKREEKRHQRKMAE